jgi:CHAT domain-containing protein
MILDEARVVASVLPDVQLFMGEEATEERLRELGPSSRFVHIAAHGYFRQDNPMFSSIRLGKSQLTLFDLYRLRLPAELVVLSGCGTGLNVVVGGDETIGLIRGLLYAGASSVVVSLWDVNDRSTAAFMRELYAGLTETPGAAASAMRRAMFAVREEYPHPYHWAAFTLTGRFRS